jgi:hypothetical protein
MNEFNIFIKKLLKLNIVKSDGETLHTQEGFNIDYHLELNKSNSMLPSVQMVVKVSYKGQIVAMWGCMGEDDQKQMVDFFIRGRYLASMIKQSQDKWIKTDGINLFNQ